MNLESLQEKNYWGGRKELGLVFTTPQARSEWEVTQDSVREVDRLVCGVEKRVDKVPCLGSQS